MLDSLGGFKHTQILHVEGVLCFLIDIKLNFETEIKLVRNKFSLPKSMCYYFKNETIKFLHFFLE